MIRFVPLALAALVLLASPFPVAAQALEEPFATLLAPGSVHAAFEERVKLRSAPSTDSATLGVAVIGDAIEVLAKTEAKYSLEGVTAFWYKARWKGLVGFVWGGLVSAREFSGDFDGDGAVETLLLRSRSRAPDADGSALDWGFDYDARLARSGIQLSDDPFPRDFELKGKNVFATLEVEGLRPAIDFLCVGWTALGGGREESLQTAFYLSGKGFVAAFALHANSMGSGGGGSLVEGTDVAGPRSTGRANVIVVTQWRTMSDGVNASRQELSRLVLAWDGKRFLPLEK